MACTEVVSTGVAEPASLMVAEGGVACNHQCAQASEGTVSVLSLYSRGEEPKADRRGGGKVVCVTIQRGDVGLVRAYVVSAMA